MIECNTNKVTNPDPVKTIIVINENRCGSNYLCALMGATGKLGNPREYFNLNMSYGNDTTIRNRHLIARKMGMTPNGITAIKLFTSHWDFIEKSIKFSDSFPNR